MTNQCDAILVPGGGLEESGELTEWARRRFTIVVERFTGKEYVLPLSRWSPHKPVLRDENGHAIDEAVVGAQYLMNKGVPSEKIIIENFSFETIGNAFFARVVHCDPRGFRKLCIITSSFHMPRTKEIFQRIFTLQPVQGQPYELDFLEASDEGLDREGLSNRIEKEQKVLEQFRREWAGLETLKAFHNHLYTEHEVYAMGKIPHRLPPSNKALY